MAIDVNKVHNLATAWAEHERNEVNRGKHVNQKGWRSREDARKDAAQKTIGLLVIILIFSCFVKFLRYLGKLSIESFGPKWGRVINIIGLLAIVLFVPTCSIVVESNSGDVTTNDIYRQQRAESEARERKEVEEYKTKVREMVVADAKERGLNDERMAVVLSTFDGKVNAFACGSAMSKIAREAGIDRAYRECWEDLPKFDAHLISAYASNRYEKIIREVDDIIPELKAICRYDLVSTLQGVQVDLSCPTERQSQFTGKSFEVGRELVDKNAAEAIGVIDRMKEIVLESKKEGGQKSSAVKDANSRVVFADETVGMRKENVAPTVADESKKIKKYLLKRIEDIKQVAKVRIEKLKRSGHWEKVGLVEYQVEQVDDLKYAGRINTTVFEEAKAIIDKVVNNAIREIVKY